MDCPICHIKLQMAERQGIEIDYCPQCRGIWLDRGELDKLIERTDTSQSYNYRPKETKGLTSLMGTIKKIKRALF